MDSNAFTATCWVLYPRIFDHSVVAPFLRFKTPFHAIRRATPALISSLKINGVDLRQPRFIVIFTCAAPKAISLASHTIDETVSVTVRTKETTPRVFSEFSFLNLRHSITGLETEKWYAFYV